MRYVLLAALAILPALAIPARAGERPVHDPAIEAAAIAILQKKLPEIRTSHDIGDDPVIVRDDRQDAKPQGISALVDLENRAVPAGRIIWL